MIAVLMWTAPQFPGQTAMPENAEGSFLDPILLNAYQGEFPATQHEADEEQETARRKRAKAIAASAVNELDLGTKCTLFQIRNEVAAVRSDALGSQCQELKADPPTCHPARIEIVNDISALYRRLPAKKAGQRLTTFKKRYDRWLTAETLQGYYNAQTSTEGTGRTLRAVVLAKAVLGEQISHMSDKQVQSKWKEESRKNKFWHRLVEAFGCAILQILSHRLTDENARNLSNKDVDAFIASVRTKWPSLREDTEDLSDLLSRFAETGSLPNETLCLERVSDEKILKESRARLFRYSTRCSCWNDKGKTPTAITQKGAPRGYRLQAK
ncbi:hypothetical protein Purlil1_12981 [Purpureocillium lilacinum]|uniref:Uncharacterized protein n=1 Tax=Purpureocillium lilacinum TaxID=33203 RepID=A0ABR0BFA7_PURLI|nr:hypothetical protein Purlil1_12981 [Purpureocillium lilacinum]